MNAETTTTEAAAPSGKRHRSRAAPLPNAPREKDASSDLQRSLKNERPSCAGVSQTEQSCRWVSRPTPGSRASGQAIPELNVSQAPVPQSARKADRSSPTLRTGLLAPLITS